MTAQGLGRPREVAALLNPAFCAVLLCESARGARQEGLRGIPFLLSFLVLPITLHQRTREALPRAISKRMHSWLEENPQLTIGFADRMQSLVRFTREGVLYGCAGGLFSLTETHDLEPSSKIIRGLKWGKESEAVAARARARFVGRWLAHGGDRSTIFAMWGVRP